MRQACGPRPWRQQGCFEKRDSTAGSQVSDSRGNSGRAAREAQRGVQRTADEQARSEPRTPQPALRPVPRRSRSQRWQMLLTPLCGHTNDLKFITLRTTSDALTLSSMQLIDQRLNV